MLYIFGIRIVIDDVAEINDEEVEQHLIKRWNCYTVLASGEVKLKGYTSIVSVRYFYV